MASFRKTGIVKPKQVSAGPGAYVIPAAGVTAQPYEGGALMTFLKNSLPKTSLAQLQAQNQSKFPRSR